MSNFKSTWSSNKLVKDSSSFWMSDSWFDDTDPLTGEVIEKDNTADLIKLSAYRRAVSNFVNIVTGDNVPVKFSNTDSYTDGKTVWIAAKLDDKNFDANVGLALHEGSHIKYSDFDVLKGLESACDKRFGREDDRWGNRYAPYELKMAVKNIINYIEDRRIDNLVYKSAPGYQGYYQSMYKKYFYSKVIDKALKSSDMRDETWESYEFRLINLHNPNTDIDALKGLREIYKLIGLGSISRLQTTDDVQEVAFQVMDVITKYVDFYTEEDEDGDSQGGSDGESGDGDENQMSGGGSSDEGGSSEGLDFDNPEDGDGGSSDGNADLDSLSDHQKRQLQNAVKKQKKFMDGNIQKKKMSKKNLQTMNQLEESGSSLESVEYDREYGGTKKVEVIKVKKLTDSIVESHSLPIISYRKDNHKEAVDDGIRLGTLLGKKLQVRSESRTTKFTRQKNGRIDKRLLSELGFNDGGNVFYSTQTDEYNKAILRISIDASGSMGGQKIASAITCATAICKAASMIENLDVVVDMRSTLNSGSGYSRRASNYYPLVVVVYDSRVDKFIKVKKHFPALSSAGTTPEGLCFEAIMSDMVESNRGIDSYFLNFSDGMPMYSDDNVYYCGSEAVQQTKKAVQKMEMMGIGILSYFITGGYSSDSELQDFKKMYGSGAQNIDVNNVVQVARTMNQLFLEK